MQSIIIAIDGHSSCGKSTLAKAIAHELGYTYIDTGAMYRAVTLHLIRTATDLENLDAVKSELANININFINAENGRRTILNSEDVEEEIRKMYVSDQVSEVAAISSVRKLLVAQQQKMGAAKGVVLDGRDIGTVVFPEAELKIFLTASVQERAIRRFKELISKGQNVTLEEIKQNLEKRDYIDSNRADSPLKKAEDAIEIDNTSLNQEQQLTKVMRLVDQVQKRLY